MRFTTSWVSLRMGRGWDGPAAAPVGDAECAAVPVRGSSSSSPLVSMMKMAVERRKERESKTPPRKVTQPSRLHPPPTPQSVRPLRFPPALHILVHSFILLYLLLLLLHPSHTPVSSPLDLPAPSPTPAMASSHSNTRQLQQQQRPERSSPHHRPWSEPRRTSVRVKHSMRKSPYLVSLVFLLAATSLTILNIYVSGSPASIHHGHCCRLLAVLHFRHPR